MIYARCPHCSTLFRISGAQLRAALGYVRCGGCNNVFNALQTLCDSPEDTPAEPGIDSVDAPSENRSSEQEAQFTSKGELDLEATPEDLAGSATRQAEEPEVRPLPFDIPEDLPDIEPAALAEKTTAADNERRLGLVVAWGFGILALSLLPFLQLSWFEREHLMESAEGRFVLEAFCGIAGCEPPYPRDPEKLRILQREISSPPEQPGTLRFRLTFVNDAENPQPYPGIKISLYTGEDVLAAERTFGPAEYLGDQSYSPLVSPATPVQVRLDIADPGQRMTGFRLEFK